MNNIGFDLGRINKEFYTICSNSKLQLEESSKSGEAQVVVEFQRAEGKQFIRLLHENTAWLNYATNKKCADGIVIECDLTNRTKCSVYIFEIKKTIDASKWTSEVKKQFRGATLRVLAFLSSLGITNVVKLQYYTCYVNVYIESEIRVIKARKLISPLSPIANKVLVGSNMQDATKAEEALEWEKEQIAIFAGSYHHYKIPLQLDHDGTMRGYIHINNAV